MIIPHRSTTRSVRRFARVQRTGQPTILDRYRAAWAANDADTLARCYSEDAVATLPGIVLEGNAAIRAEMADAFAGGLRGSRSVVEIHTVRYLGSQHDVAIVTGRSNLLFAGTLFPHPATWAQETWTMSLRNGRWLIDAHHCSLQDIA